MLTGDSETRLLEESFGVVAEQAYLMKQAMDSGNIREVLKHSSTLVGELRTSSLSPRNYYELYMQVFQELGYLHAFFSDRVRRRRRLSELYESVQHAGNILPRLYLLICVGASCIREREIAPYDTLIDLNELSKGIQQPLRGLFLRYFLIQMTKDVLPDNGDSEYPDWPAPPALDGSPTLTSAEVSFEFLFNNLTEATRLWTRIRYQSQTKDRAKRDLDRHSLRVLIGANLVCMGRLECMTVNFYRTVVFPKLVQHLKSLKDLMALEYTLECVVQVFSDECHAATLQPLCEVLGMNAAVDVKNILGNLLTRLKTFLTAPAAEQQQLEEEKESSQTKRSNRIPTPTPTPTTTYTDERHPHVEIRQEQVTSVHSVESTIPGSLLDPSFCFPSAGLKRKSSDRGKSRTSSSCSDDGLSHAFGSECLFDDRSNGRQQESSSLVSSPRSQPQESIDSKGVSHCDLQQAQGHRSGAPTVTATELHRTPSIHAKSDTRDGCSSSPVQNNTRDSQALSVFTAVREGLMDLIQKAYDEDFRFPPSTLTKPSGATPNQLEYRLTVTDLLQMLHAFLDFTLTVFPRRVDLADAVYQLVYPLVSGLPTTTSGGPTSVLTVPMNEVTTTTTLKIESTGLGSSSGGVISNFSVTEPTPLISPFVVSLSNALSALVSEPFRQSGYFSLIHGNYYSKLLDYLTDEVKALVVRRTLDAILKTEEPISDPFSCNKLYDLLKVLLLSPRPETPAALKQWVEEIETISALCHLIEHHDTDLHFSMLLSAKQSLMDGHPDTYFYTLPPLVTNWLVLINRVQCLEEPISNVSSTTTGRSSAPGAEDEITPTATTPESITAQPQESLAISSEHHPTSSSSVPALLLPSVTGITTRRILQQVHSTCVDLIEHKCNPDLVFRLLLLAADATAHAERFRPSGYSSICNEFLKQAMVCYEEDLTDNRCRTKALPLLISTLSTTGRLCLESDVYESLAEKSTRYAAKLLKGSDQCKAVLICTHLFWDSQHGNRSHISRVLECLQRCLKLATESIQFNIMDVGLLVDILEKYVFYFEDGPDMGGIPPEAISSLIGFCGEQLAFAADSSVSASSESGRKAVEAAQQHLVNLVEFIRTTASLDVNSKFHHIDTTSFMQ